MTNTGKNRRGFLSFATKLLVGIISLCFLVPALVYLWAPLRRKRGAGETAFQNVGPLADLPLGEWHLLSLEVESQNGWEKTTSRRSVWVRRQPDGDGGITVLSSICPHLGCPTNWHPDQGQFLCPCHKGTFDAEGRYVSGPPPRGLDNLEWEVRGGRLWVRWQDFKIGVAERVPVNA
jgi:menaquinol-cytochrome c reductase iron-sulfur subunit